MIIKEYDLEEEYRKYPHSVHRYKVEQLEEERKCSYRYDNTLYS